MADEFDLTRIPKLSQEIKLMKYLFLTEDQRLLLNLTSNPNFYELISKKEKMNKINILTAFGVSQHIHFKMNKLAILGGGFFMPFVASKKNQEKQFIDNILNKLNRK